MYCSNTSTEWRTIRLLPTSLVRLTGLWPQTTNHGSRVISGQTIGEDAQSLGLLAFQARQEPGVPRMGGERAV